MAKADGTVGVRKAKKYGDVRIDGSEYALDYCSTSDPKRLVWQGLATIVRCAQSDNLKVALEAGQWLVAWGEQVMAEKKAAQKVKPLVEVAPLNREQIMQELRGLYRAALGTSPLIVETKAAGSESDPGV